MGNKTNKEVGFSMNRIDENTILIEGVERGKVSKRTKSMNRNQYSKITLYLFDKEYIEKLQELEFNIIVNEKDIKERFTESILKLSKFLMK